MGKGGRRLVFLRVSAACLAHNRSERPKEGVAFEDLAVQERGLRLKVQTFLGPPNMKMTGTTSRILG